MYLQTQTQTETLYFRRLECIASLKRAKTADEGMRIAPPPMRVGAMEVDPPPFPWLGRSTRQRRNTTAWPAARARVGRPNVPSFQYADRPPML